MDRFHRRLLWPIRARSGEVIGFGARRLFDDDQMEAKYVNTPETVLYKKSAVLFGIDLAKRDIAKGHQAVVVEGYTDVMAMHLAGVTTAVASCGTAFGDEHLAMLRRLMMDDNFFRGELIYVFDGDEAGQAAALKAFDGEQNLAGQSFVAVAADGMDPCDLRLKAGDGALRDLVARRTPLFEFAIRTALAEHDLDTAEGRVAALRRCVPMVARIKDPTLRDEYARQLAGLGRLGRRRSGDRPGARRGPAARRNAAPRSRRAAAAPSRRATIRRRPRCGRIRAIRRLWPQREALKRRIAVSGAGRAGVRRADRRKLHPSRLRGRAGGHRGGGRHVGRADRRRMDRRGPSAGRRRWACWSSELGVESDPRRRRREAAPLHRRGDGPPAGGVGRAADRRGQVQAAAHVADRAGRRIPRAVRRPGRDGGLPPQPARAGKRRRERPVRVKCRAMTMRVGRVVILSGLAVAAAVGSGAGRRLRPRRRAVPGHVRLPQRRHLPGRAVGSGAGLPVRSEWVPRTVAAQGSARSPLFPGQTIDIPVPVG